MLSRPTAQTRRRAAGIPTYLGGQKIAPLANLSEDVSFVANATLNMIDFLVKEKGLSREQAYTLVSVAVDLNIAQLVDVPNLGVTAILNRDILSRSRTTASAAAAARAPEPRHADCRESSQDLACCWRASRKMGLNDYFGRPRR